MRVIIVWGLLSMSIKVSSTRLRKGHRRVEIFSHPTKGASVTDLSCFPGNTGRLFCAGFNIPDGETPDKRSDKKLLLDHLPEPIDLDLDLKENVMYISDRGNP